MMKRILPFSVTYGIALIIFAVYAGQKDRGSSPIALGIFITIIGVCIWAGLAAILSFVLSRIEESNKDKISRWSRLYRDNIVEDGKLIARWLGRGGVYQDEFIFVNFKDALYGSKSVTIERMEDRATLFWSYAEREHKDYTYHPGTWQTHFLELAKQAREKKYKSERAPIDVVDSERILAIVGEDKESE